MFLKLQLQKYLNEKCISAAELSRRTGVPKQTISDWLSGSQPRKMDLLKKVADEFGVSITDLCFGENSSPPMKSVIHQDRNNVRAGLNPILKYLTQLCTVVAFDGTILAASESFEKAVGADQKVIGRKYMEFVPPEDQVIVKMRQELDLFKLRQPTQYQHRLLDHSGKFISVTTNTMIDVDSQIVVHISSVLS